MQQLIVRTQDGRRFAIPNPSPIYAPRNGGPLRFGRRRYAFAGDDWDIGRDWQIGRQQYAFRGPRYSNMAQLEQAALARQAGGFVAQQKRVTDANRLPQPIGPVTIAASTTVDISVRPQNAIKVQQFVIRSTNAALFRIHSFTVGTDPQFVSPGVLNGDFFSSAANQDVQLKGSTANLGNEITLRVENTDAVNAQDFEAMILGPTIRSFG